MTTFFYFVPSLVALGCAAFLTWQSNIWALLLFVLSAVFLLLAMLALRRTRYFKQYSGPRNYYAAPLEQPDTDIDSRWN